MKFIAIFFSILLFQMSTQAFTVASLGSANKTKKKTDVYIVGYGGSLADQFLRVAVSRALQAKQAFPKHQQLIIWAKEKKAKKDKSKAELFGLNILESNSENLSTSVIISKLLNYKKISSFHFIGHNAAFYGGGLQRGGERLTYQQGDMSALKSRFTSDAYAFLHGCNTGFIEAKRLSQTWGLPVFGSLSSTDFQQLHKNGYWYHNNPGQSPSGGWMQVNNQTLNKSKLCWKGGCYRLQSDNHPYVGYWGKYKAGLGFFKSFCADSVKESHCLKGMLDSIKSFPSLFGIGSNGSSFTKQQYQEIVIDFLCPISARTNIREQCRQTLLQSNEKVISYTPFSGYALDCNHSECFYQLNREVVNGVDAGTFHAFGNEKNTAISMEYQKYMRAFDTFSGR